MLPKTIKLGGKKIKVSLVKKGSLGNGNNIGEWDPNNFTIEIENVPPQQRINECFVHEVIEAINSIYELKLRHWKINLLGEMLYQVIKEAKLDFKEK